MRIRIVATRLPGSTWGDHEGIVVAVQGKRATDLVEATPASAESKTWEVELKPVLQGRPGQRFVYLTWVDGAGVRFRRAKLMLTDEQVAGPGLVGHVELTDAKGGPACARVPVRWELL